MFMSTKMVYIGTFPIAISTFYVYKRKRFKLFPVLSLFMTDHLGCN